MNYPRLNLEQNGNSICSGPVFHNKELFFLWLAKTDINNVIICRVLAFNLKWPFIHFDEGWISERDI